MDISGFFQSYLGMFLAQSFLHALVAAIVVDATLVSWKIEDPKARQRFRMMVLIIPLVSFPLYQIISPARSTVPFRLDALFDSSRWLNLHFWGIAPVGYLFALLLIFTALVFLVQELIPVARHLLIPDDDGFTAEQPAAGSSAAAALELLPAPRPAVYLIQDPDVAIFAATGKRPEIYLSRGLADMLSPEELGAALAHEIGHVQRGRRPVITLLYLLRVVQLFNPIVLIEFRRIAQEEEKICDDEASQLKDGRLALASALRKLYYRNDSGAANDGASVNLRERVEEYSHSLLIENRIERLEEQPPAPGAPAHAYILALAAIVGINYFVV